MLITNSYKRLEVWIITFACALAIVFFLKDPFQGIIWSQIALSLQLPWTIFSLIYLTLSKNVMGKFSNSGRDKIVLWASAVIVSVLNIMLLMQML